MRNSIAVVMFFVGPLLAQQADIRGTVSDSTTGEGIPFANIVIVGLSRGGAANTAGFYLIPSVPTGVYEISASAIGYEAMVKKVTIAGSGSVVLNFRLTSRAIELQAVEVTAPRRPLHLEVQSSVYTISKAELKQVPVSTQADVLKSIQVLPGIVTTSDINTQFFVRGGAADQNLILLDGIRIYNPFHAFGLFSIFDPDIIKTMDVHTGSFPAEYGDRLSSVINMVTRDGNNSSFSSHAHLNFLSSKILIEGPMSNEIQALAVGRKTMFSSTLDRFVGQHMPVSFYDGFLKLSMKDPNLQNRFSLRALSSSDALSSSSPLEPNYSWSNRAIGIEAKGLSSARMFWDVAVNFGSYEQMRDSKSLTQISDASNTIEEFSVRASLTQYTEGDDIYVFGFEAYFPKVDYSFPNRIGAIVGFRETLSELSSWAGYRFGVLGLKADAGLRVDFGKFLRWNNLRSAIQPRANLAYSPFDMITVKGSFGRFSQGIISVLTDADVLPIFIPWIVIPVNVLPAQADHYVLGIEGTFDSNISATLQAFLKKYNSIVEYNRDKISGEEPDFVSRKGESRGIEALFRYSIPWYYLQFAYTLSSAQISYGEETYYPRYDRRHTVNVLSTFKPVSSLNITARWEYGSGLPFTKSNGYYDRIYLGNGFPDPFVIQDSDPMILYEKRNAARLSPYHRLDLSVSYSEELFRNFRLGAGVNLMNMYARKNLFYFDRRSGQRRYMVGFFPTAQLTLETSL